MKCPNLHGIEDHPEIRLLRGVTVDVLGVPFKRDTAEPQINTFIGGFYRRFHVTHRIACTL